MIRKANLEGLDDNGQGNAALVSDIVFAELVLYIEEIFKLAELSLLYKSQMEQLQGRNYRGCSRCGRTWARESWGPVAGHIHNYI